MTRDELARVLADARDRKVAVLMAGGYQHFVFAEDTVVTEAEYPSYRLWMLQAMDDSLVMESTEKRNGGNVLMLTLPLGWSRLGEMQAEVAR